MVHRAVRRALKDNIRIKRHNRHVSPVLPAPLTHIPGTPIVICVHSVSMRQQLGVLTRIARNAKQAFSQTLEGMQTAKPVLQARTRTQLRSLTAIHVSLEATRSRPEGPQLVSFVGQGPIRQPMVPQLGAQAVMLENIKAS